MFGALILFKGVDHKRLREDEPPDSLQAASLASRGTPRG